MNGTVNSPQPKQDTSTMDMGRHLYRPAGQIGGASGVRKGEGDCQVPLLALLLNIELEAIPIGCGFSVGPVRAVQHEAWREQADEHPWMAWMELMLRVRSNLEPRRRPKRAGEEWYLEALGKQNSEYLQLPRCCDYQGLISRQVFAPIGFGQEQPNSGAEVRSLSRCNFHPLRRPPQVIGRAFPGCPAISSHGQSCLELRTWNLGTLELASRLLFLSGMDAHV
jgi:hypothetical protein